MKFVAALSLLTASVSAFTALTPAQLSRTNGVSKVSFAQKYVDITVVGLDTTIRLGNAVKFISLLVGIGAGRWMNTLLTYIFAFFHCRVFLALP